MTEYFGRELTPRIVRALSRLPVVVVSGLRQVGKSTLLLNEQSISSGHTYRTLDDFATLEPGRDDWLRGSLFETYVAQNLAAVLEAHLPDANLSYWHGQGRYKVDFVIESNRNVIAIEVKVASRWTNNDRAGLLAFLDRTPNCIAGVLAYNGTEAAQLGDRL